jgi:SAM-dependent methyltransferase
LPEEPEEKLNTYDQRNIDTMELVYGDGFMSPGGAPEVRLIADNLSLRNCKLLDLGCGLGGACIALAKLDSTLSVTGVDIEASVLQRAQELVNAAGLDKQIDLLTLEPAPLPFESHKFDYVYANSVTCHFENLAELFADIWRVLKPGGLFIGSEWFIDRNEAAFKLWNHLLQERGLNFYFVKRERFESVLKSSGYDNISFTDRYAAVTTVATHALERTEQELKTQLTESLGEAGYSAFARWSRSRVAVLQDGGMTHTHFFARNVS